MMPPVALTIVMALAGLAVGSFLNVCIHRLPRGLSVVSPGSRCPACESPVRWSHNFPVVSYFWLRGRCASCGSHISPVYPLVEVITAALFVAHYWQIGWQPMLVPRVILACALVVLCVVDLEHRILPNVITIPGTALGWLFSLTLPPGPLASGLGILVGGGILLLTAEAYYRVRGEEGLGMGDVKMLAMIGAFLGWPLALLTLVLSSVAGALVGVGLLLTGTGDMKSALPFGSFLAMGAAVASLWGEPLIAWYVSLL
jgi:leader peptidase (prepilin peptidase) / N-methyltransferase